MWKVFIFAVAFFIGSGLAAWPKEAGAADFPINNDWMKNLDDNALITTLSIPGTHDSGADHDHCAENSSCQAVIEMASTQTYPISDQMTMGIRYFDVRLSDEDGSLAFHHGPYYLYQHLDDAIDDAQDFLSKNPSEFVFFHIKQEHTNVSATQFWADITKVFSGYPQNLFYLDRSIPTLGQVRGKIVIAARDYQTTYPQGYYIDWSYNSPYSQSKDGDLIYVAEDHCSLNTVSTLTKFVEVRQLIGLARICGGCQSNNTLYFTYLSGEGDQSGLYPAHYADYVNPNTADYLWNIALYGPRSGIIAMDYAGNPQHAGDELIHSIIVQNRFINMPGWFGTSSQGGGIAAADFNGNGKPELAVFNIHAPGKSMHDNYVTFQSANLAHFHFYLNDYSITDGQPWGGVTSGMSDYEGSIDVQAGRHGSGSVADWFNARADVAIGTRHIGKVGAPSELNFAIIGDMEVVNTDGSSALCQDIVIGQGHVGSYNNWWIGAKNGTIIDVGGNVWLECPPVEGGHCGGVVGLDVFGGVSDSFALDLKLCPTSSTDIRKRLPRHR